MSVMYCENCHRHIDTDYDTEHFIQNPNTGCYAESSNGTIMCIEQIEEELLHGDGDPEKLLDILETGLYGGD